MKLKHKILLTLLLCSATNAMAAYECTIGATPLNFGTYFAPKQTTNVLSSSTINASCNDPANTGSRGSVTIKFSNGNTTNAAFDRAMSNGTDNLRYNLFSDSARTKILGDGTSGSYVITGIASSNGTYTIYATIYANQNTISPGNYSDTITYTVTY